MRRDVLWGLAISAPALLAALVAQLALADSIRIAGVEPDIVFAAVISLSSYLGFFAGGLAGAGVGMMMDVMFLSPGVYSLQYIAAGAVSGLIRPGSVVRYLQPVLIGIPAYFAKELLLVVVLVIQGASFEWGIVLRQTLIGAAYTVAIAMVIFLIVDMVMNRRRKRAERDYIFD